MCVIRRHFRWVRADSRGNVFSRNTVARQVGPSSQGANVFFTKYGGPSSGSLLSVGGIIIFRIIRRHFLAAAVDPAVSLSTCSPRPMEVVLDHVDHAAPRAPGRWTTARPRKGTTGSWGRCGSGSPRGEEYAGSLVGCGVRLPSPRNNMGCG